MLTLITGVPGSGKTLYALTKLLLPVVGTSIKHTTADGVEVLIPRRIFTNIKGLQIDHELVEAGAEWIFDAKTKTWSQDPEGNKLGWHNWHEWAPPGALLVIDEFQKIWPPRANGAPVPPDVQAMDTHRHMGIDFIDITQNCNNVDRHLLGLVGRHLHVRRIANMPMAIVYEWDGVSRSLQFSKALSKSPWRFDKKVYKLYHSADVHTKQPRKMPALVFVVVLALAGAAWKIPESWARITGKAEQQAAASKASAQAQAPSGWASAAPHALRAPGPVSLASAPVLAAPQQLVQAAGCVQVGPRCGCFDLAGKRVEVEPAICVEASHRVGMLVEGYGATPHGDVSRGNREIPPSVVGAPSVVQSRAVAPARSPGGGELVTQQRASSSS